MTRWKVTVEHTDGRITRLECEQTPEALSWILAAMQQSKETTYRITVTKQIELRTNANKDQCVRNQ